jgi:hypothetical protein
VPYEYSGEASHQQPAILTLSLYRFREVQLAAFAHSLHKVHSLFGVLSFAARLC